MAKRPKILIDETILEALEKMKLVRAEELVSDDFKKSVNRLLELASKLKERLEEAKNSAEGLTGLLNVNSDFARGLDEIYGLFQASFSAFNRICAL